MKKKKREGERERERDDNDKYQGGGKRENSGNFQRGLLYLMPHDAWYWISGLRYRFKLSTMTSTLP